MERRTFGHRRLTPCGGFLHGSSCLHGGDPSARRRVVALARLASWWAALFVVPFVFLALNWPLGAGLLLWALPAPILGPVGTVLLRKGHDLAGVVVKALVLLPLGGVLLRTARHAALQGIVLGTTTLVLLVAIAVAAYLAHGRGTG